MMPFFSVLVVAVLALFLGRQRAQRIRNDQGTAALHSLPSYHGSFVALAALIPGLIVALFWVSMGPGIVEQMTLSALPDSPGAGDPAQTALLLNDIKNAASGRMMGSGVDDRVQLGAAYYAEALSRGSWLATLIASTASFTGLFGAMRRIRPQLRARNHVERGIRLSLMFASLVAILITVGIVLSLLFETLRFFSMVSPSEFLFGLHWSPQTALRADQVGSSGSFGAVPVFTGTLLITAIAMTIAGPIGLLCAIYLNFYASARFRDIAKPLLEILAGVPTVVYGVFAVLVIAPAIRGWGKTVGLDVASESALAAGLVMGVMIIPFVSSLSDDAITAVPTALRDGSFGLGATRSETIRYVMIPAALPGIMGGFLLAFSRAIGETMIVVMAAGLAANLSANPLEAVTTVTVQIVALLTGDQEFDSAKTLSAFALGLVLFGVTLILNVIALQTVKKYRETYD
ncbi:MAG: phosphate ABC transporter permease subunit PstC [Myxococcota bacterium]